jgi:VWFA-related protein
VTRAADSRFRVLALAAAIVAARLAGAAWQDAPSLRIVSPGESTFISGPTRLVATVMPLAAQANVARVTFFADNRLVCTAARPPYECDWDAGVRIIEHNVRAVAVFKNGASLAATVRTRALDVHESVDVDVVQVTVVVTDGNDRFVKGLPRERFRVFEDNVQQPLSSFQSENLPMELVTALDISFSMSQALPTLKTAARSFLQGLRRDDQLTMLAFNDTVYTLSRRASIAKDRLDLIDRLESWGGTALHDAIFTGLSLTGRQPGRRALLVFTDGEDQSSYVADDAIVRRVEASDVTVYMIGLGRATEQMALQPFLRRLATLSGGRALFTERADRLEVAFGEILEDLSNQYLLGYPTPPGSRDGKYHRLRVEVDGYNVRARQGYRVEPAR